MFWGILRSLFGYMDRLEYRRQYSDWMDANDHGISPYDLPDHDYDYDQRTNERYEDDYDDDSYGDDCDDY